MTRIVHLTASTFFGGPERQMLGLAEHLAPDIDTTFASFAEGGRCADFLRRATAAGFPAVQLVHDTPAFQQTLRDVRNLVDDADILFAHGYKASMGRIAARQVGIPVVGVSRGWTAETWKVRLYERLDRWNLKRLDHVVCVSHGQAAKVRRAGVLPERMTVIHNSARLGDFSEKRRAPRAEVVVLAAGRLSPEKGFQLLPAVADAVGRTCPHVRFQMAGDGLLRDSIEQDARRRGVVDRIEFLGFRPDIDRLMTDADILLLPSFTEGLPNVVLEAAAAGIPSVATAVGGTPEAVIDGETGLLVPAGDVATMADAIIRLATNSEDRDRMGRSARQHVESHFSFPAQAEAYREIIQRLVPVKESVEMQPC